MSLPSDLLEQAEYLASREPTRPKQASLRRAVSTAYYALFHLLNESAATLIAPNVSLEVNHRIQRWFDHAEMKRVCGQFLATRLTRPLLQLIGPTASADLQSVSRAFIALQEARHSADYDLGFSLTRDEAREYIRICKQAFAAWSRIAASAEANVFILSLLLWKNWDRDRT